MTPEIPTAEILRRIPRLAEKFGSRASTLIPLVICCNVNTRYLPEDFNGAKILVPSIAHTITQCDVCGDDMWIGPAQLRMYREGEMTKGCYVCWLIVERYGRRTGPTVTVGLNPDEADIPRRR